MRLVLILIMAFSANAYADNHAEEGHAKPDKALPANDPIITTCKTTAEDIGKLQDRAKMLEEQADIDLNASRPLVNPQVQGQLLETWRFMMENAEYYKNLDCHKHHYESPRRAHMIKRMRQEKGKGRFD